MVAKCQICVWASNCFSSDSAVGIVNKEKAIRFCSFSCIVAKGNGLQANRKKRTLRELWLYILWPD